MNEPRKIALTAILLLIFGLLGYAVERLKDAGKKWLALIVASIALLILALSIHYGHAHDAQRPELNSWFDSLRSAKGPCCSGGDGTALLDSEWESKDGHYRVFIKGEWIDVPDDAVLTVPNLAGRTIVWPMQQGNNGPFGWRKATTSVRCFMPGPGA